LNIPSQGSTLCLACGLCCNGVLHAFANIEPGESAFVEALGLSVMEVDGRARFRLPCPLLDEKRCSIYEFQRPRVCGNYRCELLKKYLSAEVSLESALETINRLQGLLQEVQALLPDRLTGEDLRPASANDFDSLMDSQEQRLAHPELVLAWSKFNWYVRKHFDKQKKG